MYSQKEHTLNYLGIAKKAGKLVLGTEGVVDNLPSKNISLVVLANDASENAIDKIVKKCFFYKIDVVQCYKTEELSHAIGKKNIKTIGITDQKLATVFLNESQKLQEEVKNICE